jgi:hypothetical protein
MSRKFQLEIVKGTGEFRNWVHGRITLKRIVNEAG